MDAERSTMEANHAELKKQAPIGKELPKPADMDILLAGNLANSQDEEQKEAMELDIRDARDVQDLTVQRDIVRRLENHLAHSNKESADHLHQLEAALEREHGKDHKLLALAERLKQSVALSDAENFSLLEELTMSVENQISLAEKETMAEIAGLQAEEQKWRGEVAAQSAIASELKEKVAGLRSENAALHEDLSLKIELSLKLQSDVEDLTEEGNRLSQALQEMAAEMTPLKDDLYFFREVMVPSLEERSIELENENTELRDTNQRYITEVDSLREQVNSAKAELLHLQEEHAMPKVQLIISYGALKQGEGVISLLQAENKKLAEDLGLKEHRLQMLAHSLGNVTNDNQDLRRKLTSVNEERNGLQSEARTSLLAVLHDVKQLQEELAIARMVVSPSEANERGAAHASTSNGRSSPKAEESTNMAGYMPLLKSLRDEVLFLQEEIKRNVILRAKDAEHLDCIDSEIQRLKREKQSLVEEKHELCTKNVILENTFKELQANLISLQVKNDQLNDNLSSCEADIRRLEEECLSWKGKNGELQKDISVILSTKEASAGLEERNRHLHAQNKVVDAELKELHAAIASLHKEGMVLVGMLRTKMAEALGQVKLVLEGCKEYKGYEVTIPALKKFEHYLRERTAFSDEGDEGSAIKDTDIHASSNTDDDGRFMKANDVHVSSNAGEASLSMHEHAEESAIGSRKMLVLTELQARTEEANMLLEVIESVRKLLVRSGFGEHTFGRGTSHEDPERDETAKVREQINPVVREEELELTIQHHVKLGEILNRVFMDETLEYELLQLKEDQKQLKEILEAHLDDVLRLEQELEELQGMLQAHADNKLVHYQGGRQEAGGKDAMERTKEFRQILSQKRRQMEGMKEEMVCGEEPVEKQVKLLVNIESASNTEAGGDNDQGMSLRKEMEWLKALNKRHSLELETMNHDLQRMASIIKLAQDQYLLGNPPDPQEELISIADLRTQLRGTDINVDERAQLDSRMSVDSSIQELLSPLPEEPVLTSGPFPLKPRHFEWFLLLFSPDRKGTLGAKSMSNSKRRMPTMLRKAMYKSGTDGGSTGLVASRRKVGGCLACVSATTRLDSFDLR